MACGCDHWEPRRCTCGGSCRCHNIREVLEAEHRVMDLSLAGEFVRRLALAVERRQIPATSAANARVMHDRDCGFLVGTAACNCDPFIRVLVYGGWLAVLEDGTAVEVDRVDAWVRV